MSFYPSPPLRGANSALLNSLAGFEGPLRGEGKKRGKGRKEKDIRDGGNVSRICVHRVRKKTKVFSVLSSTKLRQF